MTLSPMKGSRLADEPVFVLTSSRTNSAAEHFSYNLKMLHRAVIVGERTAGNVHAGVFHPIDEHFGMGIPEQRIVNPYGVSDWEGQGVYPDVPADAADALQTAEALAEKAIAKSGAAPR
jgi:C-terminal processing protease CtpA/Prc